MSDTSTLTATTPETIHHLEVTVAHHGDNEFYMLGRVMATGGGGVLSWNAEIVHDVTHEVPPAALFEALPDQPCDVVDGKTTCPEFCIMIDGCTEDGDVFVDKEVTVEVADRLLDGQFAERLATARGNLAEHYEYEARRPDGVSMMDWLMRLAAEKAA